MTIIGCRCPCGETAYQEFYGWCPECWKNMTPADRAVLKGEEPPVERRIIREVQVIPPKAGKLARLAVAAWRVGITAAVAYAVLR